MNFVRIGGFAGIGFAATIVLGNLIVVPAGLPSPGGETSEAIAFFQAEAAAVRVASAVTPLAWVLATVFGAGALTALRRNQQGREEAWSLVGFAGLALQNATFAGVIALRLAFATVPDSGAADVLWALHDALFTLNGTFLALALVGLTVGGRRAGLVTGWHAGLGVLAAALLFASATLAPLIVGRAGPLSLLGLAGWLLWVTWLLAYGVALLRTTPDAAPPRSPPDTTPPRPGRTLRELAQG